MDITDKIIKGRAFFNLCRQKILFHLKQNIYHFYYSYFIMLFIFSPLHFYLKYNIKLTNAYKNVTTSFYSTLNSFVHI